MPTTKSRIKRHMDKLVQVDPDIAQWRKRVGDPTPRIRPKGYSSMFRTLVAQQISIAASRSIYARLEAILADMDDPQHILDASDDLLRQGGLSRQKIGYAKSLAEHIVSGKLNFNHLAKLCDEDAIAMITSVRGFGRWSAEIYLMFAEGRPDIWPAADLGLQEGMKKIKMLKLRPGEKQSRSIAERWAPWRTTAALFAWHVYADKAPV